MNLMGFGVGIAIGVSDWMITGNPVYFIIGLGIGVALSIIWDKKDKTSKSEESTHRPHEKDVSMANLSSKETN